MIEVKGLYKSFDAKTVLSDINATFENGKTNLIIGQRDVYKRQAIVNVNILPRKSAKLNP